MSAVRYFLFAFLTFWISACGVRDYKSDARPVSHAIWDSLLQKHVSEDGWVDYRGFQQDSSRLKDYLDLLSAHHPNDKHWSREEQLAYWINAYNAFTIKLVIDHFPVESIKDIKNGIPFVNTVWDIKFIQIEDAVYDLNNIEHSIIRPKFEDPRIHFAINCASVSCPPLLNRAYTADELNEQLDQAATNFINGGKRNYLDAQNPKLSRIFSWFSGDFKGEAGSVREFVNRYANTKIEDGAEIEFLEYDWRINDVSNSDLIGG